MTGRQNKFRNTPRADKGNIWQRVVSTYQKHGPFKKNVSTPMYDEDKASEDSAPQEEEESHGLQIPVCGILSYILYIIIFLLILYPCAMMWVAKPHPAPDSRLSQQAAPNIKQRIEESQGGPISFTEQEINLHFEQNCNIIQQSGYSILAHPESIMIDIEDGYARLIIDRMLGIDFHHTIAVNLSFSRIEEEDYSSIACHLQGGEPILNRYPCGGMIGSLPIPERYMQIMIPALKRLLHVYPEIQDLVEERGYLPRFTIDEKGTGLLSFIPPNQQLLSTNN